MQRIKHKLITLEEHGGIKKISRITSTDSDDKYVITAADSEIFLLKIYSLNRERDVQANKEVNNRIINVNIRTPLILEVGKTETDFLPYELMPWIPGKSLDQLLNLFSEDLQYKTGVDAGIILRSIHKMDCHKLSIPNHLPLNERVKYVIERYDFLKKNGYSTYKGDVFKDYVLKSAYEQSEKSISMLHGDYHTGNIIEGENGELWVIDWIYNLLGDPIEDFVRIFVSADKSPKFAMGQIDGYFEGSIPKWFWYKLKMYAAIQQLEILFYPMGRLQDGRTIQEHQHQVVYEQYYGMKSIIPKFYLEEIGGK